MATLGQAGCSADQQAERRSRRNPEHGRTWRVGAEGERRTAEALEALSERGWGIFHDLAVPGSPANIDHVVIGPSGVYVIDSKAWSGEVTSNKDTLWVGRYPKIRELESLDWERAVVAERLAVAGVETIPVRAVISLTKGTKAASARGVDAIPTGLLVQYLLTDSQRVGPAAVAQVVAAVAAQFVPRTRVMNAAPTAAAILRRGLRSSRPTHPRRTPSSGHRLSSGRGRRSAKDLAIGCVLIVAGIVEMRHLASAPPMRPTGAMPSSPSLVPTVTFRVPATTTPVPAQPSPLQFTLSCTRSGDGWAANH